MLEFLVGFGVGIFIGTKYNCKPYVEFVLYTIRNTLQEIKHDFKHEKIIIDESLVDMHIKKEI